MSHEIANAIEYFPETGVFVWKISPARNVPAGSIAGSVDNGTGYRRIEYCGRMYPAHRIAWLLITGEWPAKMLDHKNCDKSDNRWANLREATRSQNRANSRWHRKLPKGVYLHYGKFRAQITKDGKRHNLGTFKTPEEAHAAYVIAAKQYFGEFARAA